MRLYCPAIGGTITHTGVTGKLQGKKLPLKPIHQLPQNQNHFLLCPSSFVVVLLCQCWKRDWLCIDHYGEEKKKGYSKLSRSCQDHGVVSCSRKQQITEIARVCVHAQVCLCVSSLCLARREEFLRSCVSCSRSVAASSSEVWPGPPSIRP